jgi:hypothetical protein
MQSYSNSRKILKDSTNKIHIKNESQYNSISKYKKSLSNIKVHIPENKIPKP